MSRKFLITIILILFLLPFVSWYYLQSGLNWRKEAQKVMSGTTPFPTGEYTDTDGDVLTPDSLVFHASILSFRSCEPGDQDKADVLERIYDQFKETRKINFIVLDSCQASLSVEQSERNSWFAISCNTSMPLCKDLMRQWPADKAFALIDRHGIIRSYYSIQSDEEKRVLVEHLSLLMPGDRQEKVELKRGSKQ